MRKYRLVAKKGEGTFSEVLKAQNVKDGKYHAIKCMKNRFESIDQVNNLREIQALRRLSPHEHIITLEEVLYDQPTGRLALVFELMDANLYELIRGRRHYLNPQLIKSYIWQLMKSLDHMHKKGIFHRDIKPENILIESSTDIGRGLKLADFGSCRGIYSKQPYTEYISTRWYRAPECLLTDGYYGPEMDLWGAGCVMFEITSLYPLFPGSNEVDQISRIHKVLGTPGQDILQKFRSKGASHISFDFPAQKGIGIPQLIPHAAADGVDLMVKLLKYDASERITAREAMRHPYFRDIRETEARQATGAGGDASSVAGSVGQKTVMSGSQLGGTKPIPQQQQQQQATTIAKALPSIVGDAGLAKPQPSYHQQQEYQQMSKPSQQIKTNASGMQGGVQSQVGGVGVNSLPPIGAGGYGGQLPSKGGQMQQQQQMMQMQQQQMQQMQQQQQQQYMQQQQGRAMQPSANSTNAQPNRRRKKYRMTYGQQPQQGMQQQQPQLQPQQVAQPGAVDYRNTNKRAGHEAVMRAYGVPKGMAGGAGTEVQAKILAQQVQGAPSGLNSYGGHPSRHYAPAKK